MFITSSQVIRKYTYWLTRVRAGDFRDVPFADVAVKGPGMYKRVEQCCDFTNVPHTDVTVKGPLGFEILAAIIRIIATP
jgi:hypothetical protein